MCGRTRTKGLGQMLVGLAVAAVAALGTAGSASATSLSYTFDSGNQGWIQSQDNGMTTSSAGFESKGGNPGGHLTAVDTGQETGCDTGATPCDLLTFFSPIVPFLSANYGGVASFDLRSSVDPEFGAEVLLLPSGDNYLDGLIPDGVGKTYHHLSLPLTETASLTTGKLSWAVCPYAGGTCAAASQAEFQSLMSASDQIAVIADVGPDGTDETYDLDNFKLTNGPPPQPQPPASPGPPATQKKKCKKKKHHRAAAAKKKCKKKKKHRRAAAAGFRG
jgi:hypothetical protein